MDNNVEHQYIDNTEREKLIELLQIQLNIDLSNYSKSSVSRRFSKIFSDFNVNSAVELMAKLMEQERPADYFFKYFTVNVTEMFRDPAFFKSLATNIFPQLAKNKSIKIWSAASSTGEEAVSLAILLHEANLLEKTTIVATDISASVLAAAREGKYRVRDLNIYAKSFSAAGGEKPLSTYFTIKNDFAYVQPWLLKNVEYKQHNLLDNPIATNFDVVICRNVLIYFNKQLQNRVIENLSQSLISAKSFLALGSKESVIFYNNRERFKEVDREYKIFQKIR